MTALVVWAAGLLTLYSVIALPRGALTEPPPALWAGALTAVAGWQALLVWLVGRCAAADSSTGAPSLPRDVTDRHQKGHEKMTAYGVARLFRGHQPPHPDVLEYLERVQSTLDPWGGRFLVHGGDVEVREGSWAGDLIIVEFPDLSRARAWYDSPAYQAILHLRTDHLQGDVLLVAGVGADYDPARLAERLRRQQGGQQR